MQDLDALGEALPQVFLKALGHFRQEVVRHHDDEEALSIGQGVGEKREQDARLTKAHNEFQQLTKSFGIRAQLQLLHLLDRLHLVEA